MTSEQPLEGGLAEPAELEPDQGALALADPSDGHTRAEWEAAAAAVLRKGRRLADDDADSEVWARLTRTTLDGVPVPPLGTPELLDGLVEREYRVTFSLQKLQPSLELGLPHVEARVPLVLILYRDAVIAEDEQPPTTPAAVADKLEQSEVLGDLQGHPLDRSDHHHLRSGVGGRGSGFGRW